MSNKVSRRDFLKIAGTAAGLAASRYLPASPFRAAPRAQADRVVIWSPGDNGTVADWNTDPILAEVEKATNTEIEMLKIDWGTYVDQVNASAASGELPDIIGVVSHESRTLIASWVRDGVVAPYEGAVAEAAPNVLAEYERNATLGELKIDGKIYMQPVGWGEGNYPNMGLLHVRKDLLDKYGMEPPDTFAQYFEFVRAGMADGSTGVVFAAVDGIGPAINAFAGAQGLPFRGWPKGEGGYGYWAVQPGIKDALILFRQMVAENMVDPVSWETDNARDLYVAGQGCALIMNGGGHTGRIQNDMDLAGAGAKEWMLPAVTGGSEARGYTAEEMFWGASFLGGMSNNSPVAAARVINYLISPEGYKLTTVGVEGIDYTEENSEIVLLDARTTRGFPTEAGNTGAHPLATTIVSWQPQEWQDWALLYGKDEEYKAWYKQMWENQGMYQIPTYGLLSTSPLWADYEATSSELINRTFLEIVNAGSDDEAAAMFDQFVSDWLAAGGADAQVEISDALTAIYG